MRLVLNHQVFGDPSVDPGLLLQLLLACRKPSPHFVTLSSVWRPGTGSPIDSWLAQWPVTVQTSLREVLCDAVESARRPRALTLVLHAGRSEWEPEVGKGIRLNVGDALLMLRAPLRVLVENRRNDGRFLVCLGVVLPTDDDRKLLDRAVRDGWVVFEQAGGLEEAHHLLRDLAIASEDPIRCPQGTQRYVRRWRLVAVIDRDAREVRKPRNLEVAAWTPQPRDVSEPSEPSKKVEEAACGALHAWSGVAALHRLRRRAIENYVPLRSLRAWVDLEPDSKRREVRRMKVEGLASLDTPDALGRRPRWYFNMKSGLVADKPAKLATPALDDAHVHPLFHALDQSQRMALQEGFTTRHESIADLLFDRTMTPLEWLRDELSLDRDEPVSLLANLLNRL